jgi:hypothetical protein
VVRKVQLPVIGGVRKVVQVGPTTAVGTTIAELGSATITLAQLAALLGVTAPGAANPGTPTAAISVGAGLSGGGPVVGVVPIGFNAPIPVFGAGNDGDDGMPGLPGATGKPGANAPIVALRGDDGEDAPLIPGPQGIQGVQGIPGTPGTGGSSTGLVVFIAEDGEDGIGFPGAPGAAGAAGAAGTPGLHGVSIQGDDGDDGLTIPGAQGLRGLPGQSLFVMLQGDDGDDGVMGPPGSTATGSSVSSVSGTANQIAVSPSTGAVVVALAANVIIPAPASGTTLTAQNTSTLISVLAQGSNSASAGVIGLQDGQTGTRQWTLNSGSAGAGIFSIRDVTAGNLDRLIINTTGNVLIPAPASGNTLQVNGVASSTSFPVFTLGSSTSGQSNGLLIEAGTTSADRAIAVTNKAVTLNLFQLFGDGSGTLGAGISWSAPGQVTIGVSSLIVSGAQGPINSGFTHAEINGSGSGVAGTSYVIATGGTDSKIWDSTIINATQFALRTVNDADNSTVNWLRVTRSGITPTAIDFIATAMTTSGTSQATGLIATAAAPTVAAGQVGYGATTATTATTTVGGVALPALVAGFLVINVAGTVRKVPFYAN